MLVMKNYFNKYEYIPFHVPSEKLVDIHTKILRKTPFILKHFSIGT